MKTIRFSNVLEAFPLVAVVSSALFCVSCDKTETTSQPAEKKIADSRPVKRARTSAEAESGESKGPAQMVSPERGARSASAGSAPHRQAGNRLDFRIESRPSVERSHELSVRSAMGQPLQSYPYWKREKIKAVHVKLDAANEEKAKALASAGNLTPVERRKREMEWEKNNGVAVIGLIQEEMRLIKAVRPDAPSEQEVVSLRDRIHTENPEFGESDMLVLEALIPRETDLLGRDQIEDSFVRKQMTIYARLAERYPQSVARPVIVRLARTYKL